MRPALAGFLRQLVTAVKDTKDLLATTLGGWGFWGSAPTPHSKDFAMRFSRLLLAQTFISDSLGDPSKSIVFFFFLPNLTVQPFKKKKERKKKGIKASERRQELQKLQLFPVFTVKLSCTSAVRGLIFLTVKTRGRKTHIKEESK